MNPQQDRDALAMAAPEMLVLLEEAYVLWAPSRNSGPTTTSAKIRAMLSRFGIDPHKEPEVLGTAIDLIR